MRVLSQLRRYGGITTVVLTRISDGETTLPSCPNVSNGQWGPWLSNGIKPGGCRRFGAVMGPVALYLDNPLIHDKKHRVGEAPEEV